MSLIITMMLLNSLSNFLAVSQPTRTINSLRGSAQEGRAFEIRSYMSPFMYPQLYGCVKELIPIENEFHSQSNRSEERRVGKEC